LNPRPSGNRLRPANGGTIAMLFHNDSVFVLLNSGEKIPVINIV